VKSYRVYIAISSQFTWLLLTQNLIKLDFACYLVLESQVNSSNSYTIVHVHRVWETNVYILKQRTNFSLVK